MIFNQNQLDELYEIIETYHATFIGINVGVSVLSNNDKVLLKNAGIKIDSFSPNTLIDNAFKFGILAEALGDKNTKGISYEDFKNYIKAGKFIPLTNEEQHSLDRVKYQAYSDIKNLGNKIQRELAHKNLEISLDSTIRNRQSVKTLSSNLANKMNDWNRDFGRISDYLMHSAYEEGRASSLESKFGADVEVYKEVQKFGACQHCIRLYLTNGLGSMPRIFKLSKLRANGTNIGKKVKDWLATLGPLHPWCRCTLHIVPSNFEWDEDTKGFNKVREWTRRVERRSKVQIKVGNKNYEV